MKKYFGQIIKGYSLPAAMFMSLLIVSFAMLMFTFIKTNSIFTLNMKKMFEACQNATTGIEESVIDLKGRIENEWIPKLKSTVNGAEIYLIKKPGTLNPADVYIQEDELADECKNGKLGDFIFNWVNPHLSSGNKFSSNVNNAVYYTNTNIYTTTVTLSLNNVSMSGWEPGYGYNKGTFFIDYEIISEGTSRDARGRLYKKTLRALSNKPFEINFLRESYAKYALLSTTFMSNPLGSSVNINDYAKITSGLPDTAEIMFRGPVYAGGKRIYIRNLPVFSEILYKDPLCEIRDADSDAIIVDTAAPDDRYSRIFPAGVVDKALFSDTSVTPAIQESAAAYKDLVNPLVAIVIALNADASKVSYTFTPPGVTIEPSLSDPIIIYIKNNVTINGTIPNGHLVTVASGLGTIYINGNLRYESESGGANNNTCIGLMAWKGDILFKLDALPPVVDGKYVTQNYILQGVYYAVSGGYGVWRETFAGAFLPFNDPANYPNGLVGNIEHKGGILCKYLFPTKLIAAGTTYGFNYKSDYDEALLFQKSPPSFPGSGRYYLSPKEEEKTKILDVYRIVW